MRASRGLKWENKMHKLKRSISGQTHEIYDLCDIDAASESRKFEKGDLSLFNQWETSVFSISQ